jgi:dihydroflavonol-4-reductase
MIGQAIVRDLQRAGAGVATLSRRGARPGNPDHTALTGDVSEAASLDFRGFDAVVHAAAFVSFGLPAKKQRVLHTTNVEGTRNVLDAAARDGVRKVVHVSSVAALGDTLGERRDESWFRERPQVFQSAYERSKYEAHRILLDESRVERAAIMPSVVLGLGDSSSGVVRRAYLERRWPVVIDHPGTIGFVHVEDVAAATRLALERGDGAYIVDEAAMTVPQLFARLESVTGVPAPRRVLPFTLLRIGAAVAEPISHLLGKRAALSREYVRSLAKDHRFDATRARQELGWDPDMDRHLAADAARFRAQRP